MGKQSIQERLSETAAQAERLREEARAIMIDVVADAHQLGMTQRQIAGALRRSQPEVSRLLKLSRPRFVPRSPLGHRLVEKRSDVVSAIEEAGCSNVRVFGSLARGEDHAESDIDLLIDIPDDFSIFDLGGLQVLVEEIIERPIDVVPARGLKGLIRSSALEDAVLL